MVKFVSYSGGYPNLCNGSLILSINGEEHSFGYLREFPGFWITGGCVSFNEKWEEEVEEGAWEVCVCEETRETFVKAFGENFLEKAIKVMNENVEWGCCGGCV